MSGSRYYPKIIFVMFGIVFFYTKAWGSTLTCNIVQSDYNTDRTTFLSNAQNTQCITRATTDADLKQHLKDDKTNRIAYNPNSENELKWFTCIQYSIQLTLRLGCFNIDPSYLLLEQKTKIRYTDSPIKDLPLFIATFVGTSSNGKNHVYHAINALYNPTTPSGLDDLTNFTFIEPQADKVYATVEKLMKEWGIATIDLIIGAPDRINEMEANQCRTQFQTLEITKFHCTLQ